ncbi:hypothetical protein M5K25_020520 [Dendrobium thyrsiflorum]|uniref:Uncharacterized protein n=1 Tax=Dendrobium thyrsiflorum TaxID=117978 RepID=A0ABD0UA32_DENTH
MASQTSFTIFESNKNSSIDGGQKNGCVGRTLEGEMSQIKATVDDRLCSMEGKVSDLHEMVKKILDNQNQMAASETRCPVGRNTNSEIHRSENGIKIIEETSGRYEERRGYGRHEPRGADWEKEGLVMDAGNIPIHQGKVHDTSSPSNSSGSGALLFSSAASLSFSAAGSSSVFSVEAVSGVIVTGFDVIGEHTGADHDRNIIVPFCGKPPGSEGHSRNRLPTVPLDGKTIGVVPFDGETTGKRTRATLPFLIQQEVALSAPIDVIGVFSQTKGKEETLEHQEFTENFGSLPASPPFRGKLRETEPPATLEKNVHGAAPGSLPTALEKSAHGRLSGAPLTPKIEFYPPRRRHRTGFPSHHAWKKRA